MDTIEKIGMLDLIDRPAFSVRGGVILRANQAAQQRLIVPGAAVSELLAAGKEDYEAFSGGCLYLTLSLSGQSCGASVSRIEDTDVFVIEDDSDQTELTALALAARELRGPLSSVMTVADRLLPQLAQNNDDAGQQLARLNRGLFQLLRLVGNMSDAARYCAPSAAHMETVEIRAFLNELLCAAANLVEQAGIRFHFTNLNEPLYCMADPEKLERALHNMLSNAMKFTPTGGSIDVRCSRREDRLYLSILDSSDGIAQSVLGSVFTRYRREPGIEDSRFGIGLGMVLVRTAAAMHGGTVLIDQPEGCGTRITFSMEIRKEDRTAVRSNALHVDYAGERDHALTELSESLPAALYEWKNIN